MKTSVWLILLLCLPGLAGAEPVVLATTILPPYQTEKDGELSGRSVDMLDCVFARLEQPWRSEVSPWRRARVEMEEGRLDGFFTAMPDTDVDRYARLSVPLALEKWYWYARDNGQLHEPGFPEELRLGALQGSHTLTWLRHRDIPVDKVVGTLPQLIKLLETGRIDAFLADSRSFEQAAEQLSLDPKRQATRFHQYMPLGVYFSLSFLETRPDFLAAFNQQVHACSDETFRLSRRERQWLTELAEEQIRPWTSVEVVIRALRQVNRERASLGREDILRLDKQWRTEFSTGEHELIKHIRDTALSRFLRREQNASNGLFQEIMATGKLGLNAGISRPTSDYWQGDETKFRDTFSRDDKGPIIEQIRYDESTRSFQVHVSLPVTDPETGEAIGVVTAGVDIQKALSAKQRQP